jgi:hypothetical protein
MTLSPHLREIGAKQAMLQNSLAPGDVVITPAVDRLSRDTTDLEVSLEQPAYWRGQWFADCPAGCPRVRRAKQLL